MQNINKILFIQFANSMFLRHGECDRYWDVFYKKWENIGYYMTVCEDLKLVEDYLKDLQEISVDDLEATIRKYLSLDNAVMSLVVPE